MTVLPVIPGAASRPTVAGTFRAEQISEKSYEMVSLTSPRGAHHRNVVGRDQQQQSSARKARRGRAGENLSACTVLPALRTVEPLLLDTDEGFFCPGKFKRSKAGNVERDSAADRESRMANIDRVVDRLHRGTPDSLNQKRSDVEAVEWLTRPFLKPKQLPNKLPPIETTQPKEPPNMLCGSSRKKPRAKSERKKTFKEKVQAASEAVFKSVTPLAEPLKVARRRGSALTESVTPISVLPECAAAAFFEAEKERALEKQLEEDEVKQPEDGKRRSILKKRVSDLLGISEQSLSKMSEAKEAKKAQQSDGWDDLLDVVLPSKKLDQKRKESCEALRLFIFGQVGNEQEHRTKDREKIFYEQSGSPEQVIKLHKIWTTIDADGSGRVDVPEFRAFAEKVGNRRLGEKAMAVLLAKRSSFGLEDLMRVIWPCAQPVDIEKMRKYIRDYQKNLQRVKTPPVLDPAELEGLVQTFRYFDADQSGTISIEELIVSGLLDREQAARLLKDWDQDSSGEMDELEFSRMLCPCGFRAYPEARMATDRDGMLIVYDPALGWRLKLDTE